MNSPSTPSPTAANWPPDEEGFALPIHYTDTTGWTLNFSEEGAYTITFRCYVVDSGSTVASDSVPIDIVEAPLYGDANGDGVVDLLDLVFVRNRLFVQDLDEGDNRQADINGDGAVDLDDLIIVRNNLGATR